MGDINTPSRQAAFIATLAVESDRFQTFEEYAFKVSTWYWNNRDLTSLADKNDFRLLSVRVNGDAGGGLPNAWVARNGYYQKGMQVLS